MKVSEVKELIEGLHLNGQNTVKGKVYGQLPSPFNDVPFCRDIKPRLNFMNENYDFKNKRFLDIGCNCGHYCFALADWGATGVGIDNDVNCIKVADAVAMNLDYKDVMFSCSELPGIRLSPCDVVLFLSTYQWIAKEHGLEKANYLLKLLSTYAEVMFFETAGSDSQAPLKEADDKDWVVKQLNDNGWKVEVEKQLSSDVGGKRWIMKCLSQKS